MKDHVMNIWQIPNGRMDIVAKNVDIPTIARELMNLTDNAPNVVG